MNPLKQNVKDLDQYFYALKEMYPMPYDKKTTSPYTKTRVILMNGTEYESVWFLHQFARHCDVPEIKNAIAVVRSQEQQQQKVIACLKPIDESILETTIGYEQLAIDLTATLAKHDTDKGNIEALNFALLEDFDHLYRFSNLMLLDCQEGNPETLVGKYTEIMPGRPTIAHHRYPVDNVKRPMNAKKSVLFSKLVANVITAAEQQTMNYYMNISQWYKTDLGRQLYAEIAMVEEEHVTQYESLKDPNCSWLENWVMHEYTEAYLYFSMYEDESNENIKKIWKHHFDMECAHLHVACAMLEKYEGRRAAEVVGDGEFPELLKLGSNKEYVRDVLERTVLLTGDKQGYIDVMRLKDNADFFCYQSAFIDEPTTPSHLVIAKTIEKHGKDYRYEESPHPVQDLACRTCDNTKLGRTNKK